MTKVTPKLKDFYENSERFNNKLCATNLDDVFEEIFIQKIVEIEVSRKEMFLIIRFLAFSFSKTYEGFKILKKGKVNEFFGVRLILDD